MINSELQFVRGPLIYNLNVLEYHRRTIDMIKKLDEKINELRENTNLLKSYTFKNPRQESIYLHNIKTLNVLERQRERLKQKLVEIQERLQSDIETSKMVTPLKPLT